jgi:hypothetical protein
MGAQAAGEQAGASALNTTPELMATESGAQAALTTNPAANPMGLDAMGNTPGAAGYDLNTSGSFIDPAKGQQYSQAYAEAAKPNSANFGRGFDIARADGGGGKYLNAMGGAGDTFKAGLAALSPAMMPTATPMPGETPYTGPLSKFKYDPSRYTPYEAKQPDPYYQAQYTDYRYAGGGPVEQMSNANAIGANTGFPMADINKAAYATPYQTPISQNVVQGTADTGVNSMTGTENNFAGGGGISDLGGYSDGGRMLKGPGDGMSDSIPAQIGGKQPARLADGEFVVPADVVSHLGNGSTDAGAKQLYKMMDRIRTQRTGKKKQAPEVNPGKAMPA